MNKNVTPEKILETGLAFWPRSGADCQGWMKEAGFRETEDVPTVVEGW